MRWSCNENLVYALSSAIMPKAGCLSGRRIFQNLKSAAYVLWAAHTAMLEDARRWGRKVILL